MRTALISILFAFGIFGVAYALTPQAAAIVDEVKKSNNIQALCAKGEPAVASAIGSAVKNIRRAKGKEFFGGSSKPSAKEAKTQLLQQECA